MLTSGEFGQGITYERQPRETPGIALIGPSGSGKSTLRDRLCQAQGDVQFVKYAPLTTRGPRPGQGEVERGEYRFVDKAVMAKYAASENKLFGNESYGNEFLTLWPERLPANSYYAYIYLPEAALELRQHFPNTRIIQVRPPGNPDVLVDRIRQRDPTINAGELALRAIAMGPELEMGQEIADATIVNDEPIEVVAERLRVMCFDLLEI